MLESGDRDAGPDGHRVPDSPQRGCEMRGRTWVRAKPKPAPKPAIDAAVREAVDAQVASVVDKLKKRCRRRPEYPRLNWAEDVFARWYRSALYFVIVMRTPHGRPPTFDRHVARMEHVGEGKFDVAVPMRRGWNTIKRQALPEDCFEEI